MACLNMFNNDQQGLHSIPAMGPRISFSNDFADSQHPIKPESSYREAPVSSDFEFSVPGFSMNINPADELFCKGKLLPLREDNSLSASSKTTLRDELLVEDDDDYMYTSQRVSKGMSMSRWKERFGLKRSSHIHHLPRKSFDKINIPHELVLERIDETPTTLSFNEEEEAYYAANSKP